jgi:hypothetical protein
MIEYFIACIITIWLFLSFMGILECYFITDEFGEYKSVPPIPLLSGKTIKLPGWLFWPIWPIITLFVLLVMFVALWRKI